MCCHFYRSLTFLIESPATRLMPSDRRIGEYLLLRNKSSLGFHSTILLIQRLSVLLNMQPDQYNVKRVILSIASCTPVIFLQTGVTLFGLPWTFPYVSLLPVFCSRFVCVVLCTQKLSS